VLKFDPEVRPLLYHLLVSGVLQFLIGADRIGSVSSLSTKKFSTQNLPPTNRLSLPGKSSNRSKYASFLGLGRSIQLCEVLIYTCTLDRSCDLSIS